MDLPNFKGFYWNEQFEEVNVKPDQIKSSSVKGVNALATYLYAAGGPGQQSRMIKDKRRTLDRALRYSYQGAFVKKYIPDYVPLMDGEREKEPLRALINSDKTKMDYDDKIISIPWEAEFEPGTVFEWCQTGTYWLVYLQEKTELAYFRGSIRRCSYIIKWLDDGQEKHTYAAIRGPVETRIDSFTKNNISIDNPNYSLNLLVPKNEDTLKQFRRYSTFLLSDGLNVTCWRVEAVDAYNTPGVIDLTAVEYYINKDEDDIENMLIDGKLLQGEVVEPASAIAGEGFIKPKQVYKYVFSGEIDNGEWLIEKGKPVQFKVSSSENNEPQIHIKWNNSYSGQFTLSYSNGEREVSRVIVVESLF